MNEIENYISEYERLKHRIDYYEEQINDRRVLLDKKVESLEEQIAYFKRKFEHEISPINDKIDKTRQTLNKYTLSHQFVIKLVDIINEISDITGIDTNEIKILGHRSYVHYQNLESYKDFSNKDEILKYIAENTKDPVNVNLSIYVKDNHLIDITFEGYLSDIEADGKTLLEHSYQRPVKISSYVKPEEHKRSEIPRNFVMIDKDSISNIMCSFNLKQIIDFKENYDNDLLSKAVINCLNKQKDHEIGKQKKLERNDRHEKRR